MPSRAYCPRQHANAGLWTRHSDFIVGAYLTEALIMVKQN
jgi:hypothetical protein